MKNQPKVWLIVAAAALALSGLACGINTVKPTPTQVPPIQILPATPPPATIAPVNDMSGLVGSWLDPDTTGAVTTIVAQGGGYAVESVINPERGGNELTASNWSGGVLTWTYCVPDRACVTSETISLDGDNLNTRWTNDQGGSGNTTLTRTIPLSGNPQGNLGSYQDMIGSWLDPDTTGTVTKIFGLEGGLAVESVINPERGGNELTTQNWDGNVLTWTYCVPNGNCITSQTVSVNGDLLETTWYDDQGRSGSTTFERVAGTGQPAFSGADMSLLVGKWLDPDTTGTITTIVAQGSGYAVESVINPDRGVNELTETSWDNGVLTWTYCPGGMHCIVSSSISVDDTTLTATWAWEDGGNNGTTEFSRVP